MEKMTMGIIYTIKREGRDFKNIANFLSKYTDTPIDYYNKSNLTQIVKHVMVDVINDLEYPSSLLFEYFNWRDGPFKMSDFDAMCAALGGLQVRREDKDGVYHYINGFRAMEGFADD